MYDPKIIQEFAQRLFKKAKSVIITCTVLGILIGATGGYAATQADTFALLGGILIGAIGFQIGTEKAFHYRLVAQTALCQVQIESNTRNAAKSLANSPAGQTHRVAA